MTFSNNLGSIDKELLNTFSQDEQDLALSILKELSETGVSKTYNDLLYQDYTEIPVDIETFITDDRYMGRA